MSAAAGPRVRPAPIGCRARAASGDAGAVPSHSVKAVRSCATASADCALRGALIVVEEEENPRGKQGTGNEECAGRQLALHGQDFWSAPTRIGVDVGC